MSPTANLVKTISHTMELDVQIFDTDCFGVMWHGAYIKWLELARVKLMESKGIKLSKPDDKDGYIYPVVEQNLKYKAPGPYQDNLKLTTSLDIQGPKMVFQQDFYSQMQQKVTLSATTTIMVCDMNWKLQRRIPAELIEKLNA